MGSGNSRPRSYTYVYNEERVRREEKEREVRRLENERKQGEFNKQIKKEEIQCIGYEQQHEKEALEEASGKDEELKRLQLEAELCRRRKELFNYKFGDMTKANENLQPHVTQLRIGLFGPTGSGKSCFINTCERAVRETEKGLADSSVGEEWTITLQDYLPEMFFHLVDTRGFFNFDYNETVEFQNILFGKVQPGDVIARPVNGQTNAQKLHQFPEFEKRVHGVIIVVKPNDPRLRLGKFKEYLQPVRDILQNTGIEPITVVTHHDTLHTEEDRQTALKQASEATGSSIGRTLFIWNYTKENRTRNPEIERMALEILHSAVKEAEKAVVKIIAKTVPREILERGPSALEAYNKARSEGTTVVKRVPIMLIGQYRSGKTSLKNSLRGQPFNPYESSTAGIDVDPSFFKVSREIWKVGEKDADAIPDSAFSYECHLARSTVRKLSHKTAQEARPSGVISPEDPDSKQASNNLTPEPTDSRDSTKLSKMSKDPQSSEIESSQKSIDPEPGIKNDHNSEEVLSSLTAILLQKKVPDEENVYSMLWDFGGESVYYTTHPIFLTPNAIYLLVNNLSQDASATAKPVRQQGLFEDFKDSYCLKTNLDYLSFWMSSVASLGSQYDNNPPNPKSELLPTKLPPVFLVCTHADTPYKGGDANKLALKVYRSLKEKPSGIHLYKNFFVVDNTKSGQESECSEVERLREEILAACNELPRQREDIPIKWLKFENTLQEEKEKGHKWISLERAKQIAIDVCDISDEKQFMTLLNFLHDQRILIHFDETQQLNELVVLDSQWLIDVFKQVITVRRYEGKEEEFYLWQKLEKEGILEEKLLEYVWAPFLDEPNTCENLLAIMEKFSLLCSLPSSDASCGKKYLVPSMLMSHPLEDINKLLTSAQIPSLFIKFKSGQVPPGLFHRLVLQLSQWSEANPNLYQNLARFYPFEDNNRSVILLCHSSSIEVVVHAGETSHEWGEPTDVSCAQKVRKQLELIMESMRVEFFWLKNMSYEVNFTCPVCCQGGALAFCRTHKVQGCKQEECLHFWPESQLSNNSICYENAAAIDVRVQVKKFAPWTASLEIQIPNDRNTGTHSACGKESIEDYLPSEVQTSLLTASCDAKEVVLQLQTSSQLEQASLKQPDFETKTLIHSLARKAIEFSRHDVFMYLRTIAPAGTTGPSLPERTDIRNIPVLQRKKLTIALSGGDDWKVLAEKLGIDSQMIRFLDNRILDPCDAVLNYIANRCFISVGYLYNLLVELGLPVIADDL